MSQDGQKQPQLCQKCPATARLEAPFVVTNFKKQKVLINVCALCLDNGIKAGLIIYTLATTFAFWKRLAHTQEVRLTIRKEGGNDLCSVPECAGTVKGKAVAVFGVVYPICGGCSNAAHAVGEHFNGPYPVPHEDAMQRVKEWGENRQERAAELGQKYTNKLATAPKAPKQQQPAAPAPAILTAPTLTRKVMTAEEAANLIVKHVSSLPAEPKESKRERKERERREHTAHAATSVVKVAQKRKAVLEAMTGTGAKPAETAAA